MAAAELSTWPAYLQFGAKDDRPAIPSYRIVPRHTFELLVDQAVASGDTLGKVECRNSVRCKRGGEFGLHTVVPSPRKALACV